MQDGEGLGGAKAVAVRWLDADGAGACGWRCNVTEAVGVGGEAGCSAVARSRPARWRGRRGEFVAEADWQSRGRQRRAGLLRGRQGLVRRWGNVVALGAARGRTRSGPSCLGFARRSGPGGEVGCGWAVGEDKAGWAKVVGEKRRGRLVEKGKRKRKFPFYVS